MKKIVFVVNHLGYGGVQKMIAFVAESSIDYFKDVSLIEIHRRDIRLPLDQRIKSDYIYDESNKKKSKQGVLSSIKEVYSTALALRKKIKKMKPDLICAFGVKDVLLTIIATLGLKIKIVGSERSSPQSYSYRVKLLSKFFYYCCDGMVFQLDNAKEYYSSRIQKKSTVIPNPYRSTKAYVPCALNKRKKIIAAATARFESRKGIDTLIQAFKLVHIKHPDYKLVIYGKGGQEEEFISLIKSLNLNDSVELPGLVSNVVDKVWNSMVFVLPSRLEGIPNVLMEVLGAGVPVVSTDCPPGGPNLLTDNGDRGLLVEVDNKRKMAEAICLIIEDRELSLKLSRKGPEVREHFEEKKIAKLWVDFFIDTLNK